MGRGRSLPLMEEKAWRRRAALCGILCAVLAVHGQDTLVHPLNEWPVVDGQYMVQLGMGSGASGSGAGSTTKGLPSAASSDCQDDPECGCGAKEELPPHAPKTVK